MKSLKVLALIAVLLPVTSYAEGFDGLYVGAAIGGAMAKDSGTGYDSATHALTGYKNKTEPDGALFGLRAGYSKLLSNKLLLGVEVGYERRNNSDSAFQEMNGVTDPLYPKATKLSGVTTALARVGYAFAPRTAAYALVGVSAVKVNRKYEAIGIDSESHSSRKNGWTVGAGVEHLLSKNISAGLEYRFSDYGGDKLVVTNWGEYYKERLTDHSVRVGVSYRF